MNIMVSVICLTYNHEKYLKDALDGFVMQKTNFPFEVLVHDDASTDSTKKILEQYAAQYPDIIKPVYETENQYSKKVPIIRDILIPMAKGKYFALCEGDDYWTDPHKLQKQVDYMESHPDCTLCTHNSVIVDKNKNKIREITVSEKDRNVPTKEVIAGGGGFMATASILAPVHLLKQAPEYFKIIGFDYTMQIYLASCGYTHCIAEYMSDYRFGIAGSWTSSRTLLPTEKKMPHERKVIAMLEAFDRETKMKFHQVVSKHICSNLLDFTLNNRDMTLVQEYPQYLQYKKLVSYKTRIKFELYTHVPHIYNILMAVRKKGNQVRRRIKNKI